MTNIATHRKVLGGVVRFTAVSARILVVDDMGTNLKIVEGLMSSYKMQIDLCKSGSEAIELIRANQYDIVFMDHMMPGMDGIETTARIRALDGDYYKNVPIVALTAHTTSSAKEKFLKSGFNDFLAKPIKTLKLNEILEKWIPREKQERYTKKAHVRDLPAFKIKGVDIVIGIAMTGSTENYLKTLAVFHKDGREKINEMESCLQDNDLITFTTYVHALKSATGSIGAGHLFQLAKALEFAGSHGDIEFIQENYVYFMEELTELLDNIGHVIQAELQSNNKKRNSSDTEFLKDKAAELKEALNAMNMGSVERIMRGLQEKAGDEGTNRALEDISRNILICEYDEALIQIDMLIKNA